MDIYTVSLFGHREIYNATEVESKLYETIIEIMKTKQYVEFLIGRNGEFDIFAASVIKKAQKKYRDDNSNLTLILPYITAELKNNEKSFYSYYDFIEIFDSKHFKSAITERNRSMIERSDLSIFYLRKDFGGAYQAKKHAMLNGKEILLI